MQRFATLGSSTLTLLLVMTLAACGGGGAAPAPSGDPPTSLVYSEPGPVYRTDGPITPNVPTVGGGTPTLFTVSPALPAGLALDPSTGVISGNPPVPAAPANFTVTASNDDGDTSANVLIEVKWIDFKSIEAVTSPTDDDLRYFLDRTHFGFSDAKFAEIKAKGLGPYLDDALGAINPAATVTLENEALANYVEDADFPSRTELALYWLHLMQRTTNPLQEQIALHWHDHFACATDVLGETLRWWYFDHIDLWRHTGAGNLRDLILAMARDWAMLEYLDGDDSTANAPNENFSREYLELFTHGVNVGHDQDDIVAGAALFSGYRRQFNDVTGQTDIVWRPNFHNAQDQTFLGVFFPGVPNQQQDEYAEVVDATMANKAQGETIGYVTRWITEQTLRRFCMEDPDPVLIDQLADILENNGFELTPWFKTMFMSEAFFSSVSRVGFSKMPVEHALGFIRATGLVVQIRRGNLGFGDGFQGGLDLVLASMGNRVTMPPVVDGWPEGSQWLSAQGMVDRANVVEFIIGEQRGFQANEGVDLLGLLPNGTATTGTEAVDALALRLGITLTPAEQTELVTYLDKDPSGNTTNDPFDASNPIHIDERVRGLLYVLGQHPKYMLR